MLHEDTDINLRALIAGKRCLYVPSAVVRHKVGSTIGREPSARMLNMSAFNQGMVMGKDLPIWLLPLGVPGLVWGHLRDTFPVRPTNWHMIPSRVAGLPARVASQFRGARKGLGKREDVWCRRQVGYGTILRWLLRRSGAV